MSADLASLDSGTGTGSASSSRAAFDTQHGRHSWSNDMSPQFCVGSGRRGGSFSEIIAMVDSPFMETRASRNPDPCFRPSGFYWDIKPGSPRAVGPVGQMGHKTPVRWSDDGARADLLGSRWPGVEGKSVVDQMITMDESAVSMHTSDTKQQPKQWLEKGVPGPV